jgi:hypothetical protein
LAFNQVKEESFVVDLTCAHRMVLKSHIDPPRASICLVVKRPGCVLCHEQGNALKRLIADEFPQKPSLVAPWAVIKEIGIDDEGLLSMYQEHFPFPFYRDTELRLYKALGDRRVKRTDVLMKTIPATRRVRRKGFTGNMYGKGEGFLLGGILIFNQQGKIRYAYQDIFGAPLPVKEIRQVLQQVIDEAEAVEEE